MKTAVVILNWNTRDFLGKFLPPLLDSMPEGAEVIVADSASDDGSRELLASRFPQVRTILLDQNYGFTGGYNRAFEAVCAMEGGEEMEYFVLINSDIEVSKGWL
ncbi:MAG: glycosyltransferase, partial [Bacteroidales bacterium]|nr:glycosyltransferase [Bacteroidales bacterium]